MCIICYKKGTRSIANNEIKWIQDNLIGGYHKDNEDFPIAMCDGCHCLLLKKIKGDANVMLPVVDGFDPGRPAKNNVVRNPALSKKKKRGRPKMVPDVQPEKEKFIQICAYCFSRIGKGYQHHCSYRREKVTNVEKLFEATPTTSQRVASRIITDAETPLLASLGPNPKAVDSKKVKRKQLFSVEGMATMQKASLSTRQTYRLAENMRARSGSHHLIESNLKEKND